MLTTQRTSIECTGTKYIHKSVKSTAANGLTFIGDYLHLENEYQHVLDTRINEVLANITNTQNRHP